MVATRSKDCRGGVGNDVYRVLSFIQEWENVLTVVALMVVQSHKHT